MRRIVAAGRLAGLRTGPQLRLKKGQRQRILSLALRKRKYSNNDISHALKEQGTPLGTTAVREILAEEGFAPLPRRLDEERPVGVGPTTEAVPMFVTSSSEQGSSPPGSEARSCSFLDGTRRVHHTEQERGIGSAASGEWKIPTISANFEEGHLKANAEPQIIAGALRQVIRNLMQAASAKFDYRGAALSAAMEMEYSPS